MRSTETRLRSDLRALAESIETVPRLPNARNQRRRPWLIGGTIALAAVAGGTGLTLAISQQAPAGTSSEPGGQPTPGVEPDWPTNDRGQTYGDPREDVLPDDFPDLIAVVATNGEAGYVEREGLESLTGANVSTPAEALEWQRLQASAPPETFIPVFLADGLTVVGEFPITRSQGFDPSTVAQSGD